MYLDGCRGAGLEPVLSADGQGAGGFDGLLLTGGVDVAPEFYIRDPEELARIPKKKISQTYQEMNVAYDRVCLSVLDTFAKSGKPVFGICRGLQVINVYFGGTLFLDIPGHRLGDTGWHSVRRIDGCMLDGFDKTFSVNSYHHQAIDRPGSGLIISARAEDGTVEAIESENSRVFAVQWHPERMLNGNGADIFRIFAGMFRA